MGVTKAINRSWLVICFYLNINNHLSVLQVSVTVTYIFNSGEEFYNAYYIRSAGCY